MDQKNRNAYKRWWRNRRNLRRALDDKARAEAAADRASRLALRAWMDMAK